MVDSRFFAGHAAPTRARDGQVIGARATRDGSLFTSKWQQALVFEGKVFGANAGTVTTAIAGHATADADQPEMAVRAAADTLVLLPLYMFGHAESGATTLGIHGVMHAISNIDVGAGTSTAGTALNLNLSSSAASSASVRTAYTGNGTDPLTAGNFMELVRSSGLIDSDAVTSGFYLPPAIWRLEESGFSPVVARTGSILSYGEGSTSAVFWFAHVWAEFAQSDIE